MHLIRVRTPEKMIRWYYKLTKRGKKFVEGLLEVINYGLVKEKEKKQQ
ncbi:hypothetical protein HY498_01380 [Candidatus Woesearchaeota archaeon]|nr:hypothetical protein [Candidatus Woesearchaeota archaeon]